MIDYKICEKCKHGNNKIYIQLLPLLKTIYGFCYNEHGKVVCRFTINNIFETKDLFEIDIVQFVNMEEIKAKDFFNRYGKHCEIEENCCFEFEQKVLNQTLE